MTITRDFAAPPVTTRLPKVGTTIFTVMSALAQQHGAVNLGQGFPDFQGDPALVDAVAAAMRAGHNQYPPMPGLMSLREAVAGKIESLHGASYDPDREITITAGATQAILTAVLALVHPGDEVIVLEPCYDSYEPALTLAGATTVRVPLDPKTLHVDMARVAAALTPRTRAIMVNTPHNPSGTVWNADERRQLRDLLRGTNVLVISDEVYEHMVFDGQPHISVCGDPELAARSLLISSFGKTFHVTGWKVGYVAAPPELMAEFRKVHQFNVFTVNTPMQQGLAQYLANPAPYLDLPDFYQAKRDLFRAGLAPTKFRLLPCEGTYFQCVDYSRISELEDDAFCRWLTEEIGVAAIPLSAFHEQPTDQRIIRFCFAKQEATLQAALARLQGL
ncbi:MAG TPA: pyridoxal phosphate-dependent aminotransferase [Ideonella sp.]|uniref:pyridoxal phosphate-dependent aminotransferase n=1 Tax=Ideonella sp. TaxID=1929293 RepID=UPI002B84E68D|nr:pyridoxal phosphate-dependent aminotransferase [Ideonella sp.]HSI50957.1 pyridoxal phosphate-dependent aminotransferase [Ideonella sp.]